MGFSRLVEGRRYLVFFLLAFSVLLAMFAVNRVYSHVICSPLEREAISSFPHFVNRQIAPKPNLEVGSCQVNYEVQSSENEVASYYQSQLIRYEWDKPNSDRIYVKGRGKVLFDPNMTYGVKNGLVYEVEAVEIGINDSTSTPPRASTFVYIHVSSLTD